jgi:hypothetical protein
MVEIKEISYGLGFTVTDGNRKWIEINKNLPKKLKKQVLAHELLHFNSKNKYFDFMIDFKDMFDFSKGWELTKFSFKHPKALLCNSPIFYENRRWSVNWFMVIFNVLLIAGIIGGLALI